MKVLVVVAHPDDEALGMGGTIARLRNEGHIVNVMFLGKGRSSKLDNLYDAKPLLYWVRIIEEVISKFAPEVIYTHYEHDLNIDHQVVYRAVLTAARPLPESSIKEIYSFEVLSSTEWSTHHFEPDVFVNIEGYMDAKITMLEKYISEIRECPHPRSQQGVRVLAAHRGMQCGCYCAEAFKAVRIIR